jgi:hypothetical protein
MVDSYIQMERTFFLPAPFLCSPFKTSHCRFLFPDQTSSIPNQFSRTGDFHTAIVKNAMKIVATAQMVRSFM